MAKTLSEFDHIIAHIFQKKYSHYEFKIFRDDPRKPDEEFRYGIPVGFKQINFYHLELFEDVMQYFGNCVKRIAIVNEKDNNLTMANRLVNEYCSESVKELDLKYISSNALRQYTKPFSAVEKLTCTISTELDENSTLNQFFPGLQQLALSLMDGVNFNLVDCTLTHLKHLELKVFSGCEQRRHQIEGLIRKNPQIQSIALDGFHFDLLRTISEVTPNLENLIVSHFKIDDHIRFGNVNNFVLISVISDYLEKLSFSHLNSFEMVYFDQNEHLSGFFKRHQHLKRLHITDAMFGPVVLDELTANLPNLVEVIVEDREVSSDSIIRFLNNHQKLMKFQIGREVDADDRELVAIFEKDWHMRKVIHDKFVDFIFERAKNLYV